MVLQEVLVAPLPKLNFGDLRAILSEHHVLLRVSSRCLLRLVEASKNLAVVFDLTIWGSFELSRHSRNHAPVKSKLQVIILPCTLYPESCTLHQWFRRAFKLQGTGFRLRSRTLAAIRTGNTFLIRRSSNWIRIRLRTRSSCAKPYGTKWLRHRCASQA